MSVAPLSKQSIVERRHGVAAELANHASRHQRRSLHRSWLSEAGVRQAVELARGRPPRVLDEIPEAGDFTVYNIGDQSVLLVRADESTVKAYHNVCPHRGTALGEGCGKLDHSQIICPFHGWRWNLHGENQFVLERQEFRGGQLQNSDVALKQVKVAVWAGFVFINFDRNAQPFEEFIAPVQDIVEGLAIKDMHHYWWKSIPVPANWKVAQEAFFEAFHVPMTHPQLEKGGAAVVRGLRDQAEFTHRYVAYETYRAGTRPLLRRQEDADGRSHQQAATAGRSRSRTWRLG